jgi:uncharacterized protein YndB with AHSA1/START domain
MSCELFRRKDPTSGSAHTRRESQEKKMTDELIICEPLIRSGGYVRGVMTMRLDHPASRVWSTLTEPQHLAAWLAPGKIDLKLGGAVKLSFEQSGVVIDSEVAAISPGRILAYSWSGPGEPRRPIVWTLAARDEGAELSLSVDIPIAEDAARGCAGWAAHLEMLAAALEGVPIKFPFERFKAQREAYREQLALV